MLASFVSSENPAKVWIGEIKRSGRDCWLEWQKQQSTLGYVIEQDLDAMVEYMETKGYSFNDLFKTLGGHPPVLKLFISKRLSLETLIVIDMVLGFMVHWDRDLKDPLWEQLSFKIKKYRPFLSINTAKYKTLLKSKFI